MRVRALFIVCSMIGFCLLTGCASSGLSFVQNSSKNEFDQMESLQQDTYREAPEILQSQPEKQLFIVFLALLQMNARPELGITVQQSDLLLPIVQESILLGELSMETRKRLINTLNPEQQLFFEEFNNQTKNRALNRKPIDPPPGTNMTEEERVALMEDLKQRRLRESELEGPNEVMTGIPPRTEPTTEKNVEQQLVEVLESKTQKE